MNVHDTIVQMMRTFPSLYGTRIAALKGMINGSGSYWDKGELCFTSGSGYDEDHDWRTNLYKLDDKEDFIAGPHHRLFKLRANATMQFTHDNAELLADDNIPGLTKKPDGYYLSEYDNRWADMPENVTEDWLAACKELAFAVYELTKDATPGSEGVRSFKQVQAFMLKQGMLQKTDVEKRITELEAELSMLKGKE